MREGEAVRCESVAGLARLTRARAPGLLASVASASGATHKWSSSDASERSSRPHSASRKSDPAHQRGRSGTDNPNRGVWPAPGAGRTPLVVKRDPERLTDPESPPIGSSRAQVCETGLAIDVRRKPGGVVGQSRSLSAEVSADSRRFHRPAGETCTTCGTSAFAHRHPSPVVKCGPLSDRPRTGPNRPAGPAAKNRQGGRCRHGGVRQGSAPCWPRCCSPARAGREPEPLEAMEPEVPADLCATVPESARKGLLTNSNTDESRNPTAACSLRSPDAAATEVRAVVTWVQTNDEISADEVLASQCRSIDRIEVPRADRLPGGRCRRGVRGEREGRRGRLRHDRRRQRPRGRHRPGDLAASG